MAIFTEKQGINNPLFTENNKKVQNYFSRRELLVNRRNKVSIVEIAEAYRDEIEKRGFTQKQLADELGVSRVRVTQILNVLKLPEEHMSQLSRFRMRKKTVRENCLYDIVRKFRS